MSLSFGVLLFIYFFHALDIALKSRSQHRIHEEKRKKKKNGKFWNYSNMDILNVGQEKINGSDNTGNHSKNKNFLKLHQMEKK